MLQNQILINPLLAPPKVLLCGQVHVPSPNEHFTRTPSEWILYLVTGGKMILREADRRYTLRTGDFLFFTPGLTHTGVRTDSSVSYRYIHFSWEGLTCEQSSSSNMPSEYFILPKHFHTSSQILEYLQPVMNELEQEFTAQKPFFKAQMSSLLTLIFTTLSRLYYKNGLSDIPQKKSLEYSIYYYLHEHHKDKLSSSTLESVFHHNYDYMNRLFKAAFGTTIFEHLMHYRIERSKELLRSGYYSVASVAEELGFCNSFYFSKTFKRCTGQTPSEYRRLNSSETDHSINA